MFGKTPAPPSCIRTVYGSANYEVFGWSATRQIAAFLIPVTLVNLCTLAILVVAMSITSDAGQKRLINFDPTDPTTLILLCNGLLPPVTVPPARPCDTRVKFGINKERIYGLWKKDEVSQLPSICIPNADSGLISAATVTFG